MIGPDPKSIYPIAGYKKLVFLKNFIKSPNIFVGDYTYFADHFNGPEQFEERNVLYNNDFEKVKLVIGKFCAIAAETRFLMTGDHKLDALSTYPFPVFSGGWETLYDVFNLPLRGDILVGNDVWFGYDCIIRGGVRIGDGAIIGTRAVVTKDVPPYSMVAGNPAKIVKMRFDDKTIERLLRIAWWDWEIEKINRHLPLICQQDVGRLEASL